jgi:hypothetical protein
VVAPAGDVERLGMPAFTPVTLAAFGIALGSTTAQIHHALGDPLIVQDDKVSRVASYLRPGDPSAVLNVTERDGAVWAVEMNRERPEAIPGATDPFGIALGMKQSEVLAKRGKPQVETANTWIYPVTSDGTISVIYRFDEYASPIVESIKVIGVPPGPPPPPGPPISDPRGDSFADAIDVGAPNPDASERFRDRYLSLRGCSQQNRRTTLEGRGGVKYAIVNATCGDRPKTYYFDISAAQ